jgi:serine/threonine protein kinase
MVKIVSKYLTSTNVNRKFLVWYREIKGRSNDYNQKTKNLRNKYLSHMVNWKEININFTEELQKEWKDRGFKYEECKKWIDMGFKTDDYDFISWLRDVKKKDIEWFSNCENKEKLREEFVDSQLSPEVVEQIRSFDIWNLTYEQRSLIEKLISNEELRERYKKYGLCQECFQPNTGMERYTRSFWCQSCNLKHFAQNFSNWTSGNQEIDKFIQKSQLEAASPQQILEWIPYNRLEIEKDENSNNKILGEGGFGEVYKAIWVDKRINRWNIKNKKWERDEIYPESIVLKALKKDSRDITEKFLQEINYHKLFDDTFRARVVRCFGISQDPKTGRYTMTMAYVEGGDLRKYLKDNYRKLNFESKLKLLEDILFGLKEIHDRKLIHRDLHSANVLIRYHSDNEKHDKGNLSGSYFQCYLTDLGLTQPIDEIKEGKAYGSMPYIAPEVFEKKPYTQKSDIYSFGIVAYEWMTNSYPYPNWDFSSEVSRKYLTSRICRGLRPNLEGVKIPQLLKNLISKCWDNDPEQRLTAKELYEIISSWSNEVKSKKNTEFCRQYQEIKDEYNYWTQNTPYKPSTVMTGKTMNTEQIAEAAKKLPKSKEISSYLSKINDQIKEIEEKIKTFKESLDSDEVKEMVDKFIELQKRSIKEADNDESTKLKEEMKKKGLHRKKRDEFIRYCEKLVELEQQLEKQEQLQANIEASTNK